MNNCDFSGLTSEDLKAMHSQTNQLVEQISKISYIFIVKFTPACLCIPNFIFSFFNYFVNGLGNDAFVLPILMWFPFEWNNPIRYTVVTILQYFILAHAIVPLSCTASYIIGILLWMNSIKMDIERGLDTINASIRMRKSRALISKQLVNFVQLHTNARQLS